MIAVSIHYRKGSRANASAPGSGDPCCEISSYCSSALHELCPPVQNWKSSEDLQLNGCGETNRHIGSKRSLGFFALEASRATHCQPATHMSLPIAAEECRCWSNNGH